MSVQVDFPLPEAQDGTLQIALAPATSILGWNIRCDFLYRAGSTNPFYSAYLSPGFTNGQSGATLVNGALGIFNVALYQSQVSGFSQDTGVLAYSTYRIDSGNATPINTGFRLLGT